ncbi:unnamed protein product [Paramecium sonneborni]|uniref:MORN repeat protein n=1 Tax=Paramecium sonneborni TaxID=65129 RepID=A0A8S1RSI6_9CILI|nr:unnamed protein product [Paramecium sonneborni]
MVQNRMLRKLESGLFLGMVRLLTQVVIIRKKEDLWKEKNFNNMIRSWIFELGEYHNNLKCGKWIQILNNYQIGGGLFNEEGLKNGTWIEMIDNCDIEWRNVGNYQNGKKIGQWNTKITKDVNISGEYYDKNGIKDGWWIDLIDRWIINDDVITCQGFYRNGKKFGKSNTIAHNFIYMDIIILMGLRRENGQSQLTISHSRIKSLPKDNIKMIKKLEFGIPFQNKIKQCKKFYEKFIFKIEGVEFIIMDKKLVIGLKQMMILNLISYHGVYISGKKFGRWEAKKEGKQINWGGFYDENGIKVGDWFENIENLKEIKEELNDHGAYKNGIKQGRWNITREKKQIIGGGVYDENGFKNGKWRQKNENSKLWISYYYSCQEDQCFQNNYIYINKETYVLIFPNLIQ